GDTLQLDHPSRPRSTSESIAVFSIPGRWTGYDVPSRCSRESIMMQTTASWLPAAIAPDHIGTLPPEMIPLIYHPKSNTSVFGLERLHPFDGLKYRRIHDALIADGLRKPTDFLRSEPICREDLERVHTREYLRSLRRSEVLAEILGVPVLARLPA